MSKSLIQLSKIISGFRILIVVSLVVIINLSCNAPRNNPFDPLNTNYEYGIIEGTVQTNSIPRTGIEGVNVLWEPENIITKTDADGKYRFNSIHTEDGNLIFYKEGFQSDTLIISWGLPRGNLPNYILTGFRYLTAHLYILL